MAKAGWGKGTAFTLKEKAFAWSGHAHLGDYGVLLGEFYWSVVNCWRGVNRYFWRDFLGDYLTLRIVFKVFLDDFDKRIRIDAEFMIAYAVDSGEGFLCNGFDPGHFS